MRIISIRTQDYLIEFGTKNGFTLLPNTGLQHVDAIERDGDTVFITRGGRTVAYPWAKTSGAVIEAEVGAAQKEVLALKAQAPETKPTQLPEGQLEPKPVQVPPKGRRRS